TASYPHTDSLVVEFGPEVYQLDADLVVEQQGLVVTSMPLTLTRSTLDISGDLDGNGRTDIFDLLAVLRVVSSGVPADDNPERYDLNSDSRVDIFDVLDMLVRLRALH
ncbi:dockerin type I domain-containing protein, partial [Gemmatimonadota bacterium]